MVGQNSLMFAPGNQGNDLFRSDPFPVDYAQEQGIPPESPETPVSRPLSLMILLEYDSYFIELTCDALIGVASL
jgi:hypothetical protein